MLASSLRSLMANYHATGGVVQDAELLALSAGLLEDARRSPVLCAFAASLATRTAGEGPERLERIVLLSDLQLGVEQRVRPQLAYNETAAVPCVRAFTRRHRIRSRPCGALCHRGRRHCAGRLDRSPGHRRSSVSERLCVWYSAAVHAAGLWQGLRRAFQRLPSAAGDSES